MDKDLVKLYEELTRAATYDKKTKTYYVSKEDYHIFGLSNDTRRNNIKKYAESLGVTFDIPYNNLPEIEGEPLFKEYNIIKSILETSISNNQRNLLEQKRIIIRNKIAECNMELIKTIINRKVNNYSIETLNTNYDIEELYQMGYEYLLSYIDNHYLEKDKFEYTIKSLLIVNIKRDIDEQIGISSHSSKELINIRKQLLESNQSIKELSSSTNLDESRIEELINLNNIVNPIRYEEIDEFYELDNPLEDRIIYEEQKEQLLKILDTLPLRNQKKLLNLLYGLNGEEMHTYRDIASIFGVSEGTICHKRKTTLTYLTSPLRTKYIKQVMDIKLSPDEENISLKNLTTINKRVLKQLEQFLIRQLDKDIFDTIISGLSDKSKQALFVYLEYIDYSEIDTIVDYHYQNRKNIALEYIRNRITELYIINNKNKEITNYLDFLMYYYLNKHKTKVRTR